VLHPQVVQKAQGSASEVSELGVMPLSFKLCDHNHGQYDVVLGESPYRIRICEQDAGVEDIRTGGPR
jgi:hypothetical protein